MDFLAVFIPLFPLLAALFIGIGHLFDRMSGDAGERIISNIAVLAISFSCFIALILLGADLLGMNSGSFSIGQWLGSDTFKIEVTFITTGYNTVLSALFSVLLLIVIRFSVNYMHRETGFRRFFFNLSLFAAA